MCLKCVVYRKWFMPYTMGTETQKPFAFHPSSLLVVDSILLPLLQNLSRRRRFYPPAPFELLQMAAKELGIQPTDPEKTDPEKNEPEKKKREYKDFGHEQEGPTSPCFLFTGSASLTFFFFPIQSNDPRSHMVAGCNHLSSFDLRDSFA